MRPWKQHSILATSESGEITWADNRDRPSALEAGPHQTAAVVGRYFNFATKQWVQM
jgi:hypothetical protein